MRGNSKRLRHAALSWVGSTLMLALLSGCSKDIVSPPDASFVADDGLRPHPRVLVADRSVTVYWTVGTADTARIREYRIFRSDVAGSTGKRVATTPARSYADPDVQNGKQYFYSVVAYTTDNKFGPISDPVNATPNLYSINVNAGVARTRQLSVTVQLAAPNGTATVELSESPGFPGSNYETFSSSKNFTLSPGDGRKTIYARFRDLQGNETAPVSGDVILDTQAAIDAVQFSPVGTLFSPGQTVHFRVRTRGAETGGTASVDIGARLVGIPLNDQGANGDASAGDGVYEADYVLPRGFDVLRVPVIGKFTDQAGNRAQDSPADSLFSLHTALSPVSLLSVLPVSDENSLSLDLTWSLNNEAGFSSYQVFRADATNGVPAANSSAFSRLTTVTGRTSVTYTDAQTHEGQKYAYRVDVVDSLGFSVPSNVAPAQARVLGSVTVNPPQPGTGTDSLNVVLGWTQASDPNFSSYQVLRAEGTDTVTSPVEGKFQSVGSVNSRTTLTFTDNAPRENTIYWYRVDVLSSAGFRRISKARPYRTLNAPPQAVTLAVPFEPVDGRVTVSWSTSSARDFFSYRVYRALGAQVDTSLSVLVARMFNQGGLSMVDSVGLLENTQYTYRVWVTDQGGLSTASTEQSLTLKNQAPPAVTLDTAVPVGTGVSVTWAQSTVKDFESYRLYRSRAADVSNASVLVATVTDRLAGGFTESFGTHGSVTAGDTLRANTDYYFRVYVYDKGGLFTGSAARAVHTGTWSQAALLPQAIRERRPAVLRK